MLCKNIVTLFIVLIWKAVRIIMKELEYPFDPEYIIKKKKSLKKQFLADENTKYIDKKIYN